MNVCTSETMVNSRHLSFLDSIIGEINKNQVEGAIVECGVWKGGCSMWMMICQKKYDMSREFFLYDTFEGMTRPDSTNDEAEAFETFNKVSGGTYSRDYDKWHGEARWAYAPMEYVKQNINKTQYDETKIRYVKGDVTETLNTVFPSSISILRLDTDFYTSTKKELDVLFPLVSKNGYIIVDDYYSWQGSRIATDEFLELNKDKVSIVDENIVGLGKTFKKK